MQEFLSPFIVGQRIGFEVVLVQACFLIPLPPSVTHLGRQKATPFPWRENALEDCEEFGFGGFPVLHSPPWPVTPYTSIAEGFVVREGRDQAGG